MASFAKALIAVGALTVGLFVFALSATFLLFAVIAVAVIALIAVGVLWARARLTGRPFGPREHFESMMMQVQLDMPAKSEPREPGQGPILDAHPTPDGWSVDR